METLDSQDSSKEIKSSNDQSLSGQGKTTLESVENRVEELVKTIAKHEKEVMYSICYTIQTPGEVVAKGHAL